MPQSATTKSLAAVRRTAARALTASEQRDAAIAAASAEGVPMRTIAEAAGLSHQRVHQIIQKGKE